MTRRTTGSLKSSGPQRRELTPRSATDSSEERRRSGTSTGSGSSTTSGHIEDAAIHHFQVTLRAGFRLDYDADG
jgi:hypothetical protein